MDGSGMQKSSVGEMLDGWLGDGMLLSSGDGRRPPSLTTRPRAAQNLRLRETEEYSVSLFLYAFRISSAHLYYHLFPRRSVASWLDERCEVLVCS